MLLLSLSLLLTGVFATTPRLMVLMLFTNDVVTMSITTEQVSLLHTPQRWPIRSLLLAALSLASVLLLFDFGVFWAGSTLLRLSLPQVQTFVFVWLVMSGQLTFYLVREPHAF